MFFKKRKFFLIGGIVLILILGIVVWQGIRFWNLIGQYLEMKRSAEMMNQFQTLNLPKQEIPTFQEWYKERQEVLRAGRGLWLARLWENLKYEIKLRLDRHGGQTPEQTWQMFIEALKKQDLDLASKFFVLERQGDKEDEFVKLKQENVLQEWINKLPTTDKLTQTYSTENTARYQYTKMTLEKDTEAIFEDTGEKIILPAGDYGADIYFTRNPRTQKWKISSF